MEETIRPRPRLLTAVVEDALLRVLDVLVASLLLLVLAPLLVVVAIAIKVDSRGPLLFRAPRVGRHGRHFAMLKFRKMVDDADGPRLTVANDSRLTRLGPFLVRSKFDELPQLWNVIRGDMSLVGPRPEDSSFVALRPHEYAEILTVTPGISGFSQLAFVKETQILDPDDRVTDYLSRLLPQKIALDRMYAQQRSLGMNLRILVWTAVAVLGRDVAVHRGTGRLNVRRRPARAPAPESVLNEVTVHSNAEVATR